MICENFYCEFWCDFKCKIHNDILINSDGLCVSYIPADISAEEIYNRNKLKIDFLLSKSKSNTVK